LAALAVYAVTVPLRAPAAFARANAIDFIAVRCG
jgi:hypothetical protein